MASPSIPAHPRRRRRIAHVGGSLGLIVAGVVFDICALINVPGAAVVSTGDHIKVSDLGTGLGFLVIAAWITTAWRRRWPLLTLVAGAVLATVGVSYVLLLIGTVVTVRRHPARTRLVGVLAAGVVAVFVVREAMTSWGAALPWYFTTRTESQYEPAWIIASFIWATLALGATAALLHYSRTRARAVHSDVRAEQEHRRADALTEQMVRQAERERIARDMHDALAHRLSVVSLHAGALEAAASAGAGGAAPHGAGEIARTVREQTHAALQDMRGLIGDLRGGDAVATSPASMGAIGALLADLRAGGARMRPYVVIQSPERASAMFDSAVFRIVQEALTNAIKHAPGAEVDIFVQVEPQSGARIRIVNSLRSPDGSAVPGGGNGVLGIRERAAALGGEAWIGQHDGTFIVDVTLPWQERG